MLWGMKKKVGNSMGQEEKYMDEYIKEISEKIEDKKNIMPKSAIKSGSMRSRDFKNINLLNYFSRH